MPMLGRNGFSATGSTRSCACYVACIDRPSSSAGDRQRPRRAWSKRSSGPALCSPMRHGQPTTPPLASQGHSSFTLAGSAGPVFGCSNFGHAAPRLFRCRRAGRRCGLPSRRRQVPLARGVAELNGRSTPRRRSFSASFLSGGITSLSLTPRRSFGDRIPSFESCTLTQGADMRATRSQNARACAPFASGIAFA